MTSQPSPIEADAFASVPGEWPMAADTGAIHTLTNDWSLPAARTRMRPHVMTTPVQMRSDADAQYSFVPTVPVTLPPAALAKWPEPCGLTPAEIRQIILDLLG